MYMLCIHMFACRMGERYSSIYLDDTRDAPTVVLEAHHRETMYAWGGLRSYLMC